MPWIDSFVSSKKFSHEFVTEFIIAEILNMSIKFLKVYIVYFALNFVKGKHDNKSDSQVN